MAGDVVNFRRNQLRAPAKEEDQGFNLTNALGIGAVALAGALGARSGLRYLADRADNPPRSVTKPITTEDLGRYKQEKGVSGLVKDLGPNKKIITEQPAPSTPPPSTGFARSFLEDKGSIMPQEKSGTVPDPWADSTDFQKNLLNQARNQAANAVESGEDQQTGRIKAQLQRNEDLDLGQVENLENIAQQSRIPSTDQDAAINQAASQLPDGIPLDQAERKKVIITGNPWETEELLEEAGNWNQAYQTKVYERGGRTAADLTGTLQLPSQKAASQLRKAGVNVRGNQVRLSEFSDSSGREGIGVNRFSPQEILERTMASVSYPREIRDQLLNPNVKIETVRKYLGTTPKQRAGNVSINPTFEIAGGAAASMPESPTYSQQTRGAGGTGLTNVADTSDWNQFSQEARLNEEGLVRDPNTGNFSQVADVGDIDPTEVMTGNRYGGAEYGDTEGVGNLLIDTEAFRERTNQGSTMIPGATQTMSGAAPGSVREERFQDIVLPLRRNAENLQTEGIVAAPSYEQEIANINASFKAGNISFEEANQLKGKLNADANLRSYLRSREVGKRQGGVIASEDPSTQGTKLVGGFQTAEPVVSEFITTQPVEDWRAESGVIKGSDGRLYSAPGKEIIGEAPLVGYRRSRIPNVDPNAKGGAFVTVPNTPAVKLTLPRAELQEVAEAAKETYFNNPGAKAGYLQRVDPDLLQAGREQGLPLSDIGEPYHYQNFITEQVDNYLMNTKGIDLPILKEGKAGTTFAMNLLKTEKATPIYGAAFKVDSEPSAGSGLLGTGRRVVQRDEAGRAMFNKGGYVIYETEDKKIPIPGRYEITGGGGVDPMTIGEDFDEGNVAYFTPRINTGPQREVLKSAQRKGVSASDITGTTSTQTGAILSILRQGMETPGVRRARISTGSGARTANPYTGAAAAASGPASRVLEGNYQYTPQQLEVNLPRARVSEQPADTVETWQPQNLDTIMNRLQAQAGRRRGKRNS
jgi:hypothetical protein